jgi:hypothetical protein
MPRYQATCYFEDSKIGKQTMEVSAATRQGAIDQLKNVYGARSVVNVEEVKSGSNSGSSVDTSGAAGLVFLAAIAWAVVSFAPFALMFVGGAGAAWLGTTLTGLSLDEDDEDPYAGAKAVIVIFLMISAGSFGFYKGTELQKWINTPDTHIQQIKK